MGEPDWNFRNLNFNDDDQGISEWDHFDKETREIGDHLLREAIQNSLDARRSDHDGPVRVRVSWIVADRCKAFIREQVKEVESHLSAAGRSPGEKNDVGALIVEDFGTTGLTGSYKDPNDKGNFRSFFYGHATSAKGQGKRGRWGLGKLVFAAMSASSCFFGLTLRSGEARPLLMGKAVIGSRCLDGRWYHPFARWCVLDDAGHEMPVDDREILDRFREVFGVDRNGEPGLSVIVPWPRITPEEDKLAETVLREWAVPILRNRLLVEIRHTRIDADWIREHAEKVRGRGALDFLLAVDSEKPPAVELPELSHEQEGRLVEDRIEPPLLEELRRRYARGEIVRVRVPVRLLPKGRQEDPRPGRFELLLRQLGEEGRTGGQERLLALRLRGDITVPDAAPLRETRVLSALTVEDGPLAEFLADAEPPAHDTWQVTAKLKERWRNAQETLSRIRTAPAELHRLLAAGSEEVIPDALKDLFWFEDRTAGRQGGAGRKRGAGRTAREASPPPPPPRRLVVDPLEGGFVLRGGPGLGARDLPCQIRVKVAYDVEVGDPLMRWDPLDFDFGDESSGLEVDPKGATVVEREGNELVLEAQDPDFVVRVRGFDPNRDLEVRPSRLGGARP